MCLYKKHNIDKYWYEKIFDFPITSSQGALVGTPVLTIFFFQPLNDIMLREFLIFWLVDHFVWRRNLIKIMKKYKKHSAQTFKN